MKDEKTNNMENYKRMNVVTEEQFVPQLKAFFSKPQTQPLVLFYMRNFDSYYQATLERVADSVYGPGKTKTIVLDHGISEENFNHIGILSSLPQRIYKLRTPPICNGYDEVTLYAEKLAKESGKHVVLMIPDANDVVEESMNSHKLYYFDEAAKHFLAWQERAQVWVADCQQSYRQKRQVFLAYQSHGILDMLKKWSEQGRMDDILRVVDDNSLLNEAYTQYVNAQRELPGMLKCSEYNEKLITAEEDTEYGKILVIKSETLEETEGKVRYYVTARWSRMTRELKFVTNQ